MASGAAAAFPWWHAVKDNTVQVAAVEIEPDAPGGAASMMGQAWHLAPLDRLLLPAWNVAMGTLRDAAPASAAARQAAGVAADTLLALAGMTMGEVARHAPVTLSTIADDAETHPAFAGMHATTLAGIAAAMAARAAT